MYIIEVSGDIVVKDCVHYVMGLTCFGMGTDVSKIEDKAIYNNIEHKYEGNLVFDKNRKAVPYALYVAHKGIQCEPPANIASFGSGGGPAFSYFQDHIESIKLKAETQFDDSIKDTYYNALFIECFSALELFLSDFVLCNVFTSNTCYGKAMEYLPHKVDAESLLAEELETIIRNYFTSSFVFHRFGDVKNLFRDLGLGYPRDDQKIRELLHKRNNIVHRFSVSNIDRMQVTNATYKDIQLLIDESCRYVSEMFNMNIK